MRPTGDSAQFQHRTIYLHFMYRNGRLSGVILRTKIFLYSEGDHFWWYYDISSNGLSGHFMIQFSHLAGLNLVLTWDYRNTSFYLENVSLLKLGVISFYFFFTILDSHIFINLKIKYLPLFEGEGTEVLAQQVELLPP